MDVHVRDLRYFVAVAEHLHFGRAAEQLIVSQPALSKQIRALERQLRTELFRRDRRTVSLTAAGAALLPAARAILEVWYQGEADLADIAQRSRSTLVVGMSTGLGRGLLPAIRASFADAAPEAILRLRQVGWDDATGGLAGDRDPLPGDGATDAAFVWLPLPEPQRFDWIVVAEEPRCLLLPAYHPLAGHDRIAFGELLDEPFLALPPSAGALRDHWLATDARGGRPPLVGAEVAGIEETAEALLAGLGVCLVAAGNAELFRRDGIVLRPVDGLSDSHLALAWRRGDKRPLLRTLIAATEQALT